MVWTSVALVNGHFKFPSGTVYELLRTTDSSKYRAHRGGVQLRYTIGGINPVDPAHPFTNPKKFQVRKGTAL